MQYFGGKTRIAKKIVALMAADLRGAAGYAELFVGGCSVMTLVSKRPALANDSNVALVNMWTAARDGWQPPFTVSEQDYQDAKHLIDTDPRKAFIGIGCSFAAKWFGGYARGAAGRNYASGSARGVLKKATQLHGVEFTAGDYASVNIPADFVVYADPPYTGTTQYGATTPFDWDRFWMWVRNIAIGRVVFVSEYVAPADIPLIAELPVHTDIRTKKSGKEARIERLYRLAL